MSARINTIFIGLWLLIVLIAYSYYATVIAKYNATDYIYKSDYSIFYQATQLYFAGENIYSPGKQFVEKDKKIYDLIQPNGNLNPPLLTLLMLGLGKLKFIMSFMIWLSLSLAAGVMGIYLLQRERGIKHFNHPATLGIITAFLCYFPTFLNFRTGQLGLFLLLGMVLLWRASRRQQAVFAGVLLGILLSIKLFLGVFVLFFIIQRRWRLLGWALLTVLISLLLGLILFGQAAYVSFYYTLHQAVWFVPNWNAAVYGYLFRIIGVIGKGAPVTHLVQWVIISYYLIGALSIGVLTGLTWPKKPNSVEYFDLGFAFTLTTCLFLSPLGWSYYFPALVTVIYIVLKLAAKTNYTKLFYTLTGISLLLSAFPMRLIKHPERLPHFDNLFWASSNFYALALLMLILILLKRTLNTVAPAVVTDLYAAKLRCYGYGLVFFLALFPSGLFGACFAQMIYG